MREVLCLVFVVALMLLPDVILGALSCTFRSVFAATRPKPPDALPEAVALGPHSRPPRRRSCLLWIGRVAVAAAAASVAALVAISAVAGLAVLSLP